MPQMMAAATIMTAPNGAWRIERISSPISSIMPAVPSSSPNNLRRDSGSRSTKLPMSVAQIGMVYARIALRPAGICCTSE